MWKIEGSHVRVVRRQALPTRRGIWGSRGWRKGQGVGGQGVLKNNYNVEAM